MRLRDRAFAVVVAVLWGGNFLAIHYGLGSFPPLLLAATRMLVLAVPTVLFVRPPRVGWRWLVGYGLGFGTGQFGLLFLALSLGLPTGLASLVLQASAPFTALLAALLLRERMGWRQWSAIAASAGGLVAIAVSRADVAPLLPLLLCLLGALSWALGNLCARKADCAEPVRLMLWMSVVPPVPLLLLSSVVEGPSAIGAALAGTVTPAGIPGLAALGYLVFGASLTGQGLWTFLLGRYPAGVVAPYALLIPVVGVGLAFLVLGERPSWVELVSGVVIIGGVLVGTPRARPAPRTPTAMVSATPRA